MSPTVDIEFKIFIYKLYMVITQYIDIYKAIINIGRV